MQPPSKDYEHPLERGMWLPVRGLNKEELEALVDSVRAGLSHAPPPGSDLADEECPTCRSVLKLQHTLEALQKENG